MSAFYRPKNDFKVIRNYSWANRIEKNLGPKLLAETKHACMDDNLKRSFFLQFFRPISRNFSDKISTFHPLKLRREYAFYQVIASNLMTSWTDKVSRFKNYVFGKIFTLSHILLYADVP